MYLYMYFVRQSMFTLLNLQFLNLYVEIELLNRTYSATIVFALHASISTYTRYFYAGLTNMHSASGNAAAFASGKYCTQEERCNPAHSGGDAARSNGVRRSCLMGSKVKRGVLSRTATQLMKSWLFQHLVVCFICIYSLSLIDRILISTFIEVQAFHPTFSFTCNCTCI